MHLTLLVYKEDPSTLKKKYLFDNQELKILLISK